MEDKERRTDERTESGTVVIQLGAARESEGGCEQAGNESGTDERKRDAEETGRTRMYTRTGWERVETGEGEHAGNR